jgi:DNA-binding response OmpR family regulator
MAKRWLVVDDDPGLLRAVAEILRAEGYGVTTARRGAEALGCIAQSLLDLIVRMLKSRASSLSANRCKHSPPSGVHTLTRHGILT